MRKKTILIWIMMILVILIPTLGATPIEWHNMPKTDNESGEIFQLRFEIKSDETMNYTITMEPGNEFSSVSGNLSMTKEIPINATRTFIFDMRIEEDLENGKHPIPYTAFKGDISFKQGNIYVRAGQQTPGFELILFLFTSLLLLTIYRKKSK